MSKNNTVFSYCLRNITLGFCAFSFFILLTSNAFARSKTQSGETAYLSSTTTTVNIEAVDLDKSILIFQTRVRASGTDKDNNPNTMYWQGKFNSSTRLYFERLAGGTANEAYISWTVIESDAFNVEPFETTWNADQLTQTITLNNQMPSTGTVDFTDTTSFVVTTGSAGGAGGAMLNTTDKNFMNARYFSAKISYDTGGGGNDQLILTREAQETSTTLAPTCELWGYVVKMMDDSTVYSGNANMGAAFYFTSVDITDTTGATVVVDRSKSFLFFPYRTNTSALDGTSIRGSLSSDTNVGFNRRGQGTSPAYVVDFEWYVIELASLGNVQTGAVNIPKGYYYQDVTFSFAVNTDLAFAMSTQDSTGTGNANYRIQHTIDVTSTTMARLERGEFGQHALSDYFITQLEPMRLFSPNGGEVWKAGEINNITWYAPTTLANVELRLSTDGGTSYGTQIIASTTNDGVYEWTIPSITGIIDIDMRVKVRDTNWNELSRSVDTFSMDVSDADFEIIPKIDLTYPTGGQVIVYEDATTITWNFYGDTSGRTVAVKYSTDSGQNYSTTLVTGQAASTTTYAINWSTGPLPLGTELRIKVEQVGEESTVFDTSDSNFTVKGDITFLTPDGGGAWNIGEPENITWTAKGTPYLPGGVDIFISRNTGGSWTLLGNVAADSSPFPWTVLSPGSTTCLARVRSVDDASLSDESASVFTILAVLSIDYPSGTQIIWRVGENKTIQWTTSGTVNLVDIYYATLASPTYPTDYTLITPPAGEPNLDSFPWTVLDDPSNTTRIRIVDHDNTIIWDESDSVFAIKGGISVSEPHAAEVINLGDNKNIIWAVSGSVTGNVNIRLSLNGGSSYGSPIITVAPTPSSYAWTPVEADMGTNNVIKVGLVGDEDPSTGTAGVSAVFAVEADLELVYPTSSGLNFYIGDEVYIKWTPNPTTFGTVNIRYDTNSGNDNYLGFIADGVDSDNVPAAETEIGYKWTIPDVAGIVSPNSRTKV